MRLGDVPRRLAELSDDLTIYAEKPWSTDARCVVALEPEDGSIPAEAQGLTYLLEVFLIRDVLAAWSRHRSGASPSPEQACEAMIRPAS